MKNLKISTKITLAFVIVNAIYILGIIALLLSYMMVYERLNNMNTEAVTPQIVIGDVNDAILRERIAAEQLVLFKPGSAEYNAAATAYETEHQKALAAIATYKDVSADEKGISIANEIESYYTGEYSTFIAELISLAKENTDAAAITWMSTAKTTEATMDALLKDAAGLVHNRIDYFIGYAHFGMVRLFIIFAVAIALVLILVACIIKYMQRMISKRIEKVTAAADLLAVGNLNIDISSDSADEIGRLTESFLSMAESINVQADTLSTIAEGDLTVDIAPRGESDTINIAIKKMIDSLNYMFAQISGSTGQVSIGSKQLAEGAQTLAQGATEQASAVEQLSHSIADVAQTTQSNSDMAQQAAELMESVNSKAIGGTEQMSKMAQAVQDISVASQSIGKVIKTIDDIAFQTNILALNAAVEAARAGQHGKGFAVVADEVRSLASKSAEAAKETGVLIENSIEKAVYGANIAEETVKSFKQIVSGINESAGLLNDIAKLSEQQSIAVKQIDQGIDQVAQVVQQNSATAEESAASSEELRVQSELLENVTSKFKVKTIHAIEGNKSYAAIEEDKPYIDMESSNKYFQPFENQKY